MTEFVTTGTDLLLWLQGLGDWLIPIMQFFTFLGTEEFYLLIMPFMFWCVDVVLGVRLGVMLGLSGGLNSILKMGMGGPRPYWVNSNIPLLTSGETSFGIPSGHAMNAVTLWGVLGAHLRRRWAWIAVLAVMLGIGFSRPFLGVHFPADVLAGWLAGIVLLILFIRLEKPILQWLQPMTLSKQIGVLFVFSLSIILLGWLVRAVAEVPLPQAWFDNAAAQAPDEIINPYTMSTVITSAGILFGVATGFAWLIRNGGFHAGGAWSKRIVRYILGMVIVVAIWAGLDAVFGLIAADETLVGGMLRFIRYALIGLWAGGIAPKLFRKWNLAEGS